MFTSDRNFFEALRLIEAKGSDQSIVDEVQKILNAKKEFEQYDMDVIYRLNDAAKQPGKGKDYLHKRGITDASIDRYLLGYSEKQGMVTIPVHSPDGMCVGFVGRSIVGKEFKNSTGLPRSRTMFNLHRIKRYDKIFVVEASFDAMRIEQTGRHAAATLGASVSSAQIDLLKRYFNSIILVQDDDDAGLAMRTKLKQYLGSTVIAAKPPAGMKDIGDMDDVQLESFLAQFDNELDYILQITDKEKR
jgi:DNA primase